MAAFNKPNVVLPLAASYNERGTAGFTNTVTNSLDQRKINSMYEPVKNVFSGNTTLYLVKRPGMTDSGGTWGTTGQVAYLVSLGAGLFGSVVSSQWIFSTSGNDVRASNSSGTDTVILTAANNYPTYVDKTAISGTDNLVLQTRNSGTGVIRTYFSTAIGSFTEITDSDFTGLTSVGKMEFLDGYAFVADSATQRIYNSDLNSLANWTPSNYITKQIVQDGNRGLARFKNQILCFGNETVEVFVNQGTPSGSPLVTVPSLFSRVGLPNQSKTGYTHYYTSTKDRMYFVGRGALGVLSYALYSYNGQQFDMVSNDSVNKIITQATKQDALYSVNRVLLSGKEAIALALDPTTASTQRWLMYFPAWNEWFEWNSTTYTPVNNGPFFLGVGANQHKLMTFDPNTEVYQDNSVDYTWTHQFQLPSDGNNRKMMPYMALKGDTARSSQNISVQFSDDDGQSWSTARTIDMTGADKMLTRCGSYKGARQVRLFHAGNTALRLEKFLSRIE